MTTPYRPKIAIIPGDPSGIGPELVAKLLSLPHTLESADIILLGDAHVWHRGATQAARPITLNTIRADDIPNTSGLSHVALETIEAGDIRIAEVTKAGGNCALRCLDMALDLGVAGYVDGILFAPFNKAAMTLAGLNAEDEHRYIARYLGFTGYHSEINVLGDLMTTRVTSHIGLREVAAAITQEGILRAVQLAYDTAKRSGIAIPRIGVAALNPHAGDNGKFGREEIDILTPAIREAQARRMEVSGPWPSDTVFLKAKRAELDAVVTMYHDQGQIAIKLMGFDRGVTVAGGIPIPIATPAHGTAFDIAGQNKADVGATRAAFELLVRMAKNNQLK